MKRFIALLLSVVMLILILIPSIIKIAEANSYYDAIIDEAIDKVMEKKAQGNSLYYDLMIEYKDQIDKDTLLLLYKSVLSDAQRAKIESEYGNVIEELDNISDSDIENVKNKINAAISDSDGLPTGNGETPDIDPKENDKKEDKPEETEKPEVKVDFTDISFLWQEAQDAINFMANRGVLHGKSEGIFAPNDPITRAEFAKTVVALLELNNDTTIAGRNFKDVDKSKWYYEYIQIAFKHGIIEGRDEETFSPDDLITRQEMAVMAARIMKLMDKAEIIPPLQAKEMIKTYADSTCVADWAETEMALAIKNKIIQGKDGKRLAPKDNATRAEAVVILKRLYNLLNN